MIKVRGSAGSAITNLLQVIGIRWSAIFSQAIKVSGSAITGVSQVAGTRGHAFEAKGMTLAKFQSRAQNRKIIFRASPVKTPR